MSRLIIDYPDDMLPEVALIYAREHVRPGRISEAAGMSHFCWATAFRESKVLVHSRRKKAGQKSDSLLIYRTEAGGERSCK